MAKLMKKARSGCRSNRVQAIVTDDVGQEVELLQNAMKPSLNQVSYIFNGQSPKTAQDYARNSLIYATKLMSAQEFRNLRFTFSRASGEGGTSQLLTSDFNREKFYKVEDAAGIEVMFKLAALAEIRSAPQS